MSAALIVGVVLALGAALFVRRTVFSGDRTRRMRWRIRMHMRPGPGFASVPELLVRWGRLAALHHGRRARPGLKLHGRLRTPTTDYAGLEQQRNGQWR